MNLPYNTLTPILGEEATDHTPESETTPEFMNSKFNELLENDKTVANQVDLLNGKFEFSTCTLLNGWTGSVTAYKCNNIIHFYGRVSGGTMENGTAICESPYTVPIEYSPVYQTTGTEIKGWLYSYDKGISIHALSTNNDICINILTSN